MIRRETDPDILNRIANSPGVREVLGPGDRAVDLTFATDRPGLTGVIALTDGDDALCLFEITAPRVYQSHILFAKGCRGRKAIETAMEMIAWMFSHGADVVWGDIPRDNAKACWFGRRIGAHILPSSDETHLVFEVRKTVH